MPPHMMYIMTHCVWIQEEVMAKLDSRLDEAVSHWPRLGYLTREELVKALAYRGDPEPIIPLINRVFPKVRTLHYLRSFSSSNRDINAG